MLTIQILGVLVLSFNLFTIWKIYKSNIYQKWWKYLFPLVINFPTIKADQLNGVYFKLLNFYFLGSHIMLEYQSLYAAVALPLGSLYIWWKLRSWEVSKDFDQIGK